MNDTKTPAVNIHMTPVTSSQIQAIGYDAATKTLAVRFVDKPAKGDKPAEAGSLYHYANVELDQFLEFSEAESTGSYFIRKIKPNSKAHPYTRINETTQDGGHD